MGLALVLLRFYLIIYFFLNFFLLLMLSHFLLFILLSCVLCFLFLFILFNIFLLFSGPNLFFVVSLLVKVIVGSFSDRRLLDFFPGSVTALGDFGFKSWIPI